MNTINTNNPMGDSILANRWLAQLATVDANDYAYWANNNGKGIDVKVGIPAVVKAILAEHCARKKQTQADFMRQATIDALTRELTVISRGEATQ